MAADCPALAATASRTRSPSSRHGPARSGGPCCRAGGTLCEPEAVPGEPRQPAPAPAPSSAATRTPRAAPRSPCCPAERPAPPSAAPPAAPARCARAPPPAAARRQGGPLSAARTGRGGACRRLPLSHGPRGARGAPRLGYRVARRKDRETEAQRGEAARPRSPSEGFREEACALGPRVGSGAGRGERTPSSARARRSGLWGKAEGRAALLFKLLNLSRVAVPSYVLGNNVGTPSSLGASRAQRRPPRPSVPRSIT